MAKIVNIQEAKSHLSHLLERVRHGETVITAKAGEPVAQLTGYSPSRPVIGVLDHLGLELSDEQWEEFDQALAKQWFDCLRDPVEPD